MISWYTGMLIIACAEQTNTDKYEDLALEAYGPRMAKITSWSVIANLLGFVISNIVYIKTLVPHTLEILIWGSTEEAEGKLPSFMGNGQWTGQIFWATAYCVVVIIPLSLSRNLSALRYTSIIGFLGTIYLVFVILSIFFLDRHMVDYSIGYRFKHATWFRIDIEGIIRAMAYVVFAYTYQASIPVIYRELERANYRRMDKVIARASFGAVVIYMLVSTFGYMTWVGSDYQLELLKKT